MRKSMIGHAGRASEKKLIKELGGRSRPGSGALVGAKGDIDFNTVLMEAKSTVKDSLSLKLDWLAKITAEARSEGKTAALAVTFTMPDGSPVRDGEWVMVPKYVWNERIR